MQRRFQRASLVPSGFAVMKWRLSQSAFKFGFDRPLARELAQLAVDRADEAKARYHAGQLTCL